MQSISVRQLREQLEDFTIIDVREKWEWDIGHIAKACHIPLKDFTTKSEELDQNSCIAVVCHHGGRSAKAAAFLLQQGFTTVYNVSGGMDAWSKEIDPSVPLY